MANIKTQMRALGDARDLVKAAVTANECRIASGAFRQALADAIGDDEGLQAIFTMRDGGDNTLEESECNSLLALLEENIEAERDDMGGPSHTPLTHTAGAGQEE